MTDREAFEAWAKAAGAPFHYIDIDEYSESAWVIWQAAKATAPAWHACRLTREVIQAQPERKPAHTEAEVREILEVVGPYRTPMAAPIVRRVLGVPAPEDKPALVCQEQQLEDEDPWLSGDDMMGDN